MLMFFDEARFGTHSKLGHGWFKKGLRTAVPIKLGFKNFYLYSAVNCLSGSSCTLMLPKVNSFCMNIYLKELSSQYADQDVLLVMDGAGWHKSNDLKIPKNIKIIYLPPYSPELNPVEKLWQHIKENTIRNKVFDTIDLLENLICEFVAKMKKETIKSVCACNYIYN